MISESLCIIETFEQNWRGNFLILILTEQPTSNQVKTPVVNDICIITHGNGKSRKTGSMMFPLKPPFTSWDFQLAMLDTAG
jgi:hypothetical protein